MIKIGFDIMGSDEGPVVAYEAAKKFAKDNKDIIVCVYGNKDEFKHDESIKNIEVIDCKEFVSPDEGILTALRKKDASLIKAIHDVKDKKIASIVSAGSTGVYLSASAMILKNIEGVKRPALMPLIPQVKSEHNKEGLPLALLDAGASTEISSEFLHQYAIMGDIFAKNVLGVASPKIGLLNIGTEDKKGLPEYQEANKILRDSNLNFVGNVEGRDVLNGVCHVLVADGFAGNITLKVIEGVAKTLFGEIRKGFKRGPKTMIGALLSKGGIKKQLAEFDYRQTGGALLIGVNGHVIKAHGSSDAKAFYNALRVSKTMAQKDVVSKIAESFAEIAKKDKKPAPKAAAKPAAKKAAPKKKVVKK